MVIEAEAYRSLDQQKCRALFAEFKQNDTWQVPTLTVRRMWGRLDDSKFTSDPRLAYIDRKSRDRWAERIQPQLQRWASTNIGSPAASSRQTNTSPAAFSAPEFSSWPERTL